MDSGRSARRGRPKPWGLRGWVDYPARAEPPDTYLAISGATGCVQFARLRGNRPGKEGTDVIRLTTQGYALEIELLNYYCHDALFTAEGVHYAPEANRLSINMLREMTERAQRERRLLFLTRYAVPTIKCMVVFHGVLHAQVDIRDVEDNVAEITFDESAKVMTIHGVRGSRIELRVDHVEADLIDHDGIEGRSSVWAFK